jgi:hypothetical protein
MYKNQTKLMQIYIQSMEFMPIYQRVNGSVCTTKKWKSINKQCEPIGTHRKSMSNVCNSMKQTMKSYVKL